MGRGGEIEGVAALGLVAFYLMLSAMLGSNPESPISQWLLRTLMGGENAWVWREGPVAMAWSIPAMSMAPTLLTGDRALGVKYGRAAQRGDIWTFDHPHDDKVMVKRIVGLGGDAVEIKGGQLFLNDRPVSRTFVRNLTYVDDGMILSATEYEEQLPGETRPHLIHEFSDQDALDETPRFVVPQGHYFMMGDSRDNSEDSRVPSGHRPLAAKAPELWPLRPAYLPSNTRDDAIGFVPEENLIARVVTVPVSFRECRRPADLPQSVVCLKPSINKRL